MKEGEFASSDRVRADSGALLHCRRDSIKQGLRGLSHHLPIRQSRRPFLKSTSTACGALKGAVLVRFALARVQKSKECFSPALSNYRCAGLGSSKHATIVTSSIVRAVINKYNMKSLLDAPCGEPPPWSSFMLY